MKSLLILVITLLFAVPSFAYHFESESYENDELETLYAWGTLQYHRLPGVPYYGDDTPYFESLHSAQEFIGVFRLDEGDSLSSLTTISINTDIQIDSSVPSNNLSGDVFIYHSMYLYIYNLLPDGGDQLVYGSVYDAEISHSLGDSDSLSFAWTHEYAFIPGKEYVISNALLINSFMDAQVHYLVGDRDDESFNVNTDWEVTADISFVHTPVPEPSTLILLGSGMAGLVFFYRRKRD